MNDETNIANDVRMYINPIRIGRYEQPKSFLGRFAESMLTTTYLHGDLKHLFLGESSVNYKLKDFAGYDRAEILNDKGKVTYVDKYDKREVDVHISRKSGEDWIIDKINEHVLINGHNGTLRPLSKLELLVK